MHSRRQFHAKEQYNLHRLHPLKIRLACIYWTHRVHWDFRKGKRPLSIINSFRFSEIRSCWSIIKSRFGRIIRFWIFLIDKVSKFLSGCFYHRFLNCIDLVSHWYLKILLINYKILCIHNLLISNSIAHFQS